MTAITRLARAERKAYLVARGELDRAKITLAVHEVRAVLVPPASPERIARLRPAAKVLVALAAPLFGFRRLSRLLRLVSLGLLAARVARAWRG
jgi:hypothetical protein